MSAQTIRVLRPEVVARIAAGEVVQSPAGAIKELIENSEDAKATMIKVIVGPLCKDVFMVADDGIGISPVDFPLLCERFATSKIEVYEDVFIVESFGFRGEALASISFVATVLVISKQEDSIAYAGIFKDGALLAEPQELDPGCVTAIEQYVQSPNYTIVVVVGLFSNDPLRQDLIRGTKAQADIVSIFSSMAITHPTCCYQLHIMDDIDPVRGELAFVSDLERCNAAAISGLVLSLSQYSILKAEYVLHESVLDRLKAVISLQYKIRCTAISEIIVPNICNTCKLARFYYTDPRPKSSSQGASTYQIFVNRRTVQYPRFRALIHSVLTGSVSPHYTVEYAALLIDTCNGGSDPNIHPSKQRVLLIEEEQVYSILLEQLTARLQQTSTSTSQKTSGSMISPASMHTTSSSASSIPGPKQLPRGSLYKRRDDSTTGSIMQFVSHTSNTPFDISAVPYPSTPLEDTDANYITWFHGIYGQGDNKTCLHAIMEADLLFDQRYINVPEEFQISKHPLLIGACVFSDLQLVGFLQTEDLGLICIDLGELLVSKFVLMLRRLLDAETLWRNIFLHVPVGSLSTTLPDGFLSQMFIGCIDGQVQLLIHPLLLLAHSDSMHRTLEDHIHVKMLYPDVEELQDVFSLSEEAFVMRYLHAFIDCLHHLNSEELQQVIQSIAPSIVGDREWMGYVLESFTMREILKAFNRVM
ncbi:Mlh1-like protein [Giardia muris]|uniref:Mlh1-like protein n=1 Tax=Giardia muris TaxID=5742 RepID=A0A4Z1T0D6_GIAMU|nr:Mlh1-like protein [Giardia muris]|eukprot:TNJ30445.1 Mlh1-like protein [Giardia muris]